MDYDIIAKIIVTDEGLSMNAEYDCNLKYFKGNLELAKKIIQSTVEHFRNEMINNSLAVSKSKVTVQ